MCVCVTIHPKLPTHSFIHDYGNKELLCCNWFIKNSFNIFLDFTDPQNTCLTANGTRSGLIGWWAGLSAALTNVTQCRVEDQPAGLHWLKYQNPLNPNYPDQVSYFTPHLCKEVGSWSRVNSLILNKTASTLIQSFDCSNTERWKLLHSWCLVF